MEPKAVLPGELYDAHDVDVSVVKLVKMHYYIEDENRWTKLEVTHAEAERLKKETVTIKYETKFDLSDDTKWIDVTVTQEIAYTLMKSDWALRRINKGLGVETSLADYIEPTENESDDEEFEVADEFSNIREQLEEMTRNAIWETKRDLLNRALRILPPVQRQVVTKKFYEGRWVNKPENDKRSRKIKKVWEEKSNREIARELGKSKTSVNESLEAGLKNIWKFFKSIKYHREIFEEYQELKYGFPQPYERVFVI